MGGKKSVNFNTFIFLPVVFVFLVSCSQRSLSIFFDLPPEKANASAKRIQNQRQTQAQEKAQLIPAEGTKKKKEVDRPEIESTMVWVKALNHLPKINGQPDWMEALRTGVVAPRASIDGDGKPDAQVFKFDFYLPGPSDQFDAFFPHSAHTEWLGCDSCHPTIFRTRGTKVTMADLYAGKYCAVCHGPVAFGLSECARCHTGMGK
jgi:c(7)-type cytochrome triheme protein